MMLLTDRTTDYAKRVCSGQVAGVGKREIQACQRHLDDIQKSDLAPFAYYFDPRQAQILINFAEKLTIAEGDEETPFVCADFQAFILGSLHGWRTKDGNHRRYRTSYIQLARQQGKSILNGILATFYGNFTKYKYAQIYCAATKTDQAKIVFNEVVKFIRSDHDLEALFNVHEHNSTIDCKLTGSRIRALSGDTKRIDGFRPYLGIVDEYHAHKNNQVYKLLEGGTKFMKSCLISVITTAGFNLKYPCHKMYETCCDILDGTFDNPTRFVFIAEMDQGDDYFEPTNWLKPNPLLRDRPDLLGNMIATANEARLEGGDTLRDFVVKQLNCWIQAAGNNYIDNAEEWTAGASDRTLKDFIGSKVYAGLDLSSGGDLTSISIVVPYYVDGEKQYFVFSHSFMPSRRLEEHIQSDDAPYDVWVRQGLITVTETMGGVKTDYRYILNYLKQLIADYDLDLQVICYDPHNASAFLADLEEIAPCLSVTQTHRVLSTPTEDLRLEIKAGHVEYNGDDALLTRSMLSAKTVGNSYGEVKIDKEVKTDRIDPVDALIDAWLMAMQEEQAVNLDDVVEEYLSLMGAK